MTNKKDGTLYVGVTSNLLKRMWEHKNHVVEGFTDKYNLDKLVYYEQAENILSAIEREKKLKRWRREWKIKLIEEKNPNWNDLYVELIK